MSKSKDGGRLGLIKDGRALVWHQKRPRGREKDPTLPWEKVPLRLKNGETVCFQLGPDPEDYVEVSRDKGGLFIFSEDRMLQIEPEGTTMLVVRFRGGGPHP